MMLEGAYLNCNTDSRLVPSGRLILEFFPENEFGFTRPDYAGKSSCFIVTASFIESPGAAVEGRYAEKEMLGMFSGDFLCTRKHLFADAHSPEFWCNGKGPEVASSGKDRVRNEQDKPYGLSPGQADIGLWGGPAPKKRPEVDGFVQSLPGVGGSDNSFARPEMRRLHGNNPETG